MENPELQAQLAALNTVRDQAKTQLDLSLNGIREETIRSFQAALKQSQSQYTNANNEYIRLNN